MKDRIRDAAVLGAGIAGSSLAKALADRGWDTVLIDRRQFPRHKVCGEFLSPESLSMLNSLGLRTAVESLQPSVINRTRLIFSHGEAIELPLPGSALGVSRYALDTALHEAAIRSGVQVETGTTATSVHAHAKGYGIETRQEGGRHTVRARTVIAAWGANLRSGLPGHNASRASRNTYVGVKTHYSGIDMGPVVELYFFSGGYLGISPIEGGRVNVAALLKREAFHSSEKTVLGILDAAARRNPKLYAKLRDAVPVPGTQAAVAPVDVYRRRPVWEQLPHVGDAAQMIPPLCGDGMSMALRSAQRCAPLADRYLRGEISLAQWESAYTKSIRNEFKGPLRWGLFLQWLFSLPLVPRLLPGLVQLSPALACGLVQATRLRETDEHGHDFGA